MTFLGVVAAALAAERAGLSMALGTFLLGATLSVSPLFNTFVILALKFGIILLLAFAGALPRPDAMLLAVALAQCGEFGFVLHNR